MLNKIKTGLKSFLGQKCLFCGKTNDERSFKAMVKVPGYLDKKEKYFCSPECLEAWGEYAKERSKHNKCSSRCCR